MLKRSTTLILFITILFACQSQTKKVDTATQKETSHADTVAMLMQNQLKPSREAPNVIVGADRTELYYPILEGKRIAVVTNQTGMTKNGHIVDVLHSKFKVVNIFAPEHGIRGQEDAGAHVDNSVDSKTGIPIISLYGNNKKPYPSQMEKVDVVVFDIQDVGARFYTYLSTLHYVMEACADNGKEIIVLDRPNPNGGLVDGPVLEAKYSSFVGLHPVPIVYGMTIGEYAKMINGEGWLARSQKAALTVVPLENWNHDNTYSIKIAPSPNLRTDQSIMLYPSLCLFEGTTVSVGRGTETPFEQFGSPNLKGYEYSFTPKPSYGSKDPKWNGKKCYGENLHEYQRLEDLYLGWILDAYVSATDKDKFFNNFFEKLAGTGELRKQIEAQFSPEEIKDSWKPKLDEFKAKRQKYLIYE